MTMKDADPDSFTNRVLVSFVLHALLRVNRTFNYLELRRELSYVLWAYLHPKIKSL